MMVQDAADVYFSYNVVGSHHVLFSGNVVNKSYVYKNEVLSKEEREEKWHDVALRLKSYVWLLSLQEEYAEEQKKWIYPAMTVTNAAGCIGDQIGNAEQVVWGFNVSDAQHVRYAYDDGNVTTSMDIYENYYPWSQGTHVYEGHGCNNSNYGVVFNRSHECQQSSYVFDCYACEHIFLSYGARNKKYLICNTQYTPAEREQNVQKIIVDLQKQQQWGEFFPTSLSPHPYNDSVASVYYPIKTVQYPDESKIEINKLWHGTMYVFEPDAFISKAELDLGWWEKILTTWRTKEHDVTIPSGIKIVHACDLPDSIENVSDDILEKAVVCAVSWRPFRIVWPELSFYRRHWLPLPRCHPDVRHAERIAQRPKRDLFLRKCDKCGKEMVSVYPVATNPPPRWIGTSSQSQGGQQKVYCEACYTKEFS